MNPCGIFPCIEENADPIGVGSTSSCRKLQPIEYEIMKIEY